MVERDPGSDDVVKLLNREVDLADVADSVSTDSAVDISLSRLSRLVFMFDLSLSEFSVAVLETSFIARFSFICRIISECCFFGAFSLYTD